MRLQVAIQNHIRALPFAPYAAMTALSRRLTHVATAALKAY